MITQETKDTITTTKTMLLEINEELNHCLQNMTKLSYADNDRKILHRIREENIKSLLLLDSMVYNGEIEL